MVAKRITLILLFFTISSIIYGCAAEPYFFNGKYYMAGDLNCRYWRYLSSDRIMCMDSQKVDKGYRDAMTDQQLQMYMNQRQVNATLMAPQLAPIQQPAKPTKCYPDLFGGSMTCY